MSKVKWYKDRDNLFWVVVVLVFVAAFGYHLHVKNQQAIHKATATHSNCSPDYTPCVPNVSYDLDCKDIGEQVHVIGPDVYHLDADGDGVGCESY